MTRDRYFSNYRPEMDGLRGIACLIVLVGHSFALNSAVAAQELRGIPKIGVWLFFVLSSFLLTLKLLDRGITADSVASYFAARFLRIYPIFAAAILVYKFAGTVGIDTWDDVFRGLTMRFAPGHLWTIPMECSFYVVLPLALIGFRWGTPWGMAVLLGATLAATYLWPPAETPENNLFVGWYAVTFASGAIAAVAARSKIGAFQYWAIVPVCLFAVLAVLLLSKDLMNKHFLFGPAMAVLVLSVLSGARPWQKALAWKPLVWIGEASFSIYLFQWLIVVWLTRLPTYLAVPSAILTSILVGRAGFVLIESPLYELRRTALNWSRFNSLAATRTGSGSRSL